MRKMNSKKLSRYVALVLVASMILQFGGVLRVSEAQAGAAAVDVVADTSPTGIGNFWTHLKTQLHEASIELKEYVLDGLVWTIANMAIESISTSIVRWINSGFEGSPAFVQDLKGHFAQLESQILGKYLNDIGAGFLCSPFSDKIKRSLEIQLAVTQSGGRNAREAQFRRANQCTLDDVLSSLGTTIDQFTDDFSQGGWPAWVTITRGKNNEIGAYLIVRNELFRRQGEAVQQAKEELSFGSGFMSWKKKCGSYDTSDNLPPIDADGDSVPDNLGTQAEYTEGDENDLEPVTTYPEREYTGECDDPDAGKIQTPGSVIEKQLNEALGSGQRRLEVADEIDEIISALFSQMMKQVLGGAGGLLGTTQSSPGRDSYIDQVQNGEGSLDTSLASLKRSIEGSLSLLEGYTIAKQNSYGIVGRLVETLEDWRACLIEKINAGYPYQNELAQVESKLSTQRSKLDKLRIELEVSLKLEQDLNTLNNSTTQIDTRAELDSAYTQYTTLTTSLSSRFNRVDAQREESDIRASYTQLQSEAEEGLNRCEFTPIFGF